MRSNLALAAICAAGLAVATAGFIVLGKSIAMAAATLAPAADTVVSVPWGDWLGTLLVDGIGVLAVAIMGIVLRFLPASLRSYLTAQRTAQGDRTC